MKGGKDAPMRLQAEICKDLDAAEATAWDRVGGPDAADFEAIKVLERELGYRVAQTGEVALWRARRLQRALDNDWSGRRLSLLQSAVDRDAERFEDGQPTRPRSAPIPQQVVPVPPTAPPPMNSEAAPLKVTSASVAPPAPSGLSKLAYSINEAAEAISMSKSALYEDIAAGRLTARKRQARTIILAEELRRYLDELPASR